MTSPRAKDTAAQPRRAADAGPAESGSGTVAPERIHDLKTWPEYFEAMLAGIKPFELRLNDRGYRVGDVLRLREYAPGPGEYSGRVLVKRVTYMLSENAFGLRPGYCLMAIADAGNPLSAPLARRHPGERA